MMRYIYTKTLVDGIECPAIGVTDKEDGDFVILDKMNLRRLIRMFDIADRDFEEEQSLTT